MVIVFVTETSLISVLSSILLHYCYCYHFSNLIPSISDYLARLLISIDQFTYSGHFLDKVVNQRSAMYQLAIGTWLQVLPPKRISLPYFPSESYLNGAINITFVNFHLVPAYQAAAPENHAFGFFPLH